MPLLPLHSLRALTGAFLVVAIGVTVATALATYMTTMATIDHLVMHRIELASATIAPQDEALDLTRAKARIQDVLDTRDNGDLGMILSRAGRVQFSNVSPLHPLRPGMVRLDRSDAIPGLTHGWAWTRDINASNSASPLRLTVIAETEPFDDYHTLRILIYVLGFGSIIAVITTGAVLFSRTVRRRIVALHTTVDAIIAGDMRRRVPTNGSGSEFDRQAQAFNRMLCRIGDLMDEIRHVSNGVAHELRTPLARLRSQLSLIAGDPTTPPSLRLRVEDALTQSDQMLAMFNALMRMAEIESGHRRARFAAFDLTDLIAEALEAVEADAQESGHVITSATPVPVTVTGDRQLLMQLLMILLTNALRHTPPGTTISVSVQRAGEAILLSVQDNGPGIAPADRPRALTRFGRLETGTSGTGHGIGLPLAQAIARLHGGTLNLGDAHPGLWVTVQLPG